MSRRQEEARLAREREFHNRAFSEESRVAQGKYYAAIKDGAWDFERTLRELSKGKDVLEYGCGNYSLTHAIAQDCRTVTSIDISDVAMEEARTKAALMSLSNASFQRMNAEAMEFKDQSFDVIFGRGILHHLDTKKAIAEVARVLRPDGVALFWEPLGHNLLINYYRKSTPLARSEDEHPLLKKDIDNARQYFSKVDVSCYGLTTLLSVPMRDTKMGDFVLRITGAFDRALFAVPGLKWQAWHCMIVLSKPRL